ncbi:MAG: hypothetical protein RR561_08490 [Peptostreptococcus sp.]|uniref:hypothetical protein n=1 Tax=Peptostreptococcus sp. TaxID=1262 RepID=UPI002FC72042
MFAEISIRGIFQLIIGMILMFVGLNTIRRQKKIENPKTLIKGKLLYARHVKEKDNHGFYRQYYYELHIECKENGKKERYVINSMDEYKSGDTVEIMSDPSKNGELKVFTKSKTPVIGQWVMAIIGLFIFLTPFAKIKFGEMYLAALVAPICIAAGIGLLLVYLREHKRVLEAIEAEVVGVLKWQKIDLGKDGQKKHKAATALYCPVLRYDHENTDRIRRSRGHSNDPSMYPIGRKVSIYKDKNSGEILEDRPKQSMALMGVILAIMGFIGAATVYFQV